MPLLEKQPASIWIINDFGGVFRIGQVVSDLCVVMFIQPIQDKRVDIEGGSFILFRRQTGVLVVLNLDKLVQPHGNKYFFDQLTPRWVVDVIQIFRYFVLAK